MAETFRDTLSVQELSHGTYQAEPFYDKARQGNVLPIAYGGIVLGQTISAGYQTIPKGDFHLYSAQGTYLGPASTEVPTKFIVEDIRTTRTFITRLVTAKQQVESRGKKEERKILIILMDWHVKETEVLLEYSNTPLHPMEEFSKPDQLLTLGELADQTLSPAMAEDYRSTFPLFLRFLDSRPCTSTMGVQTLFGWAREKKTTQDHLPLTKRTNAGWFRTNEELTMGSEQCAALAFIMDGALGFLPLTFTKRALNDTSACSSLDFSLRIFSPVNLSQWHLQEQYIEAGGGARTFGVGRLWDAHGKEVACMTQTGILRPKKETAKL